MEMKKENLEKRKFNFEKFEVAKLSNMKNIRGGNNNDGDPTTVTNTNTDKVSSRICKSLGGTNNHNF
jgi:hypothetical protein